MAEDELAQAWKENQCGDSECERVRLEAALLVLRGHADDHKYYARVVAIGKQEIHKSGSQAKKETQ